MNHTTLCPACLADLPDDYAFDHVAIDRALTSQPELIDVMARPEQREVVVVGFTRGMTITCLTRHFRWTSTRIRNLLPVEHPESAANARRRQATERAALDATVRTLWDQGTPDTDIALRTGRSVYVIAGSRRRLGLPNRVTRHDLVSGGTQ